MKLKNKVNKLISQYQTRQHLRNLPAHLFNDIGQTQLDIANEINKNKLMMIIAQYLRYLIKRS
jgi:uncharacterized protein YjiS (DUF1127 family)